MDQNRESSLLPQCRLCGINGNHIIEILDGNSLPTALCGKIFQCVGIRVEQSDKSTKICGNCLCAIYQYDQYRALCVATNRNMISEEENDDVIADLKSDTKENSLRLRLPSSEQLVISLVDDETESENDERDAQSASVTKPRILHGENTMLSTVAAAKRRSVSMNSAELATQNGQNLNTNGVANTVRESRAQNSPSTLCEDGAEPVRNKLKESSGSTNSAIGIIEVHDSSTPQQKLDEANANNREPERYRSVAIVSLNMNAMDSNAGTIIVKPEGVEMHDKNSSAKACQRESSVGNFPIMCRSRGACKDRFESRGAMMQHLASYHSKGVKITFSCHSCKKTFASRRNLQRHMNTRHTARIRFMCPIRSCSTIFTTKFNLQVHTNAVHTKEISLKCTECPMKFYYKGTLKQHMANEHGDGIVFCCHLCKKGYSSRQSLQQHMFSAHTHVRHKCSFPRCSKYFTRKETLKEHMNAAHTKKKVFECKMCDVKYFRKYSLRRHFSKCTADPTFPVHGIE